MATVYKFRVWCVTEAAWQYVWSETEPTECPNDSGHTIDAAKTASVESAGDDAQVYTTEGAALVAKKDRAELAGNSVILKRLSAALNTNTSTSKDWVIPNGKTWKIRLFSASAEGASEVQARLEYWTPSARSNPFDGDADEPLALLWFHRYTNANIAPFYESLAFVGDGSAKLRIVVVNGDNSYNCEIGAYFNGYEMDTPA